MEFRLSSSGVLGGVYGRGYGIPTLDGAEWSRTVVVEISSIDAEYQRQYLLFGVKCLLSEKLNLFFQLEDIGCAEIVVRY